MGYKYPEGLLRALLRSARGISYHRLVSPRTAAALTKLPNAVRRVSYLSCTRPLLPAHTGRLAIETGRRKYVKAQNKKRATPKRQIAILGGGITGLTAAHYLARNAKNAHITLYEASDRLGGWIDGKTTKVEIDGESTEVLMQRGPRMLRSGATTYKYDDLVLYDVVSHSATRDFRSCLFPFPNTFMQRAID
jgi:protoporphyrinogen/coproporphyrinogen III oxidase